MEVFPNYNSFGNSSTAFDTRKCHNCQENNSGSRLRCWNCRENMIVEDTHHVKGQKRCNEGGLEQVYQDVDTDDVWLLLKHSRLNNITIDGLSEVIDYQVSRIFNVGGISKKGVSPLVPSKCTTNYGLADLNIETGTYECQELYQLDTRRWYMLGLFFGVSCMNGLSYMTLATVADTFKKIYQVDDAAVNFLLQIYYITFVIFYFPSSILINKYGLRFSIFTASLLTTLGLLLRAPGINFYCILLGNAIMASAQPFFLGLPTLLSMNWFGKDEWGIVTGIAAVANQLGLALGFAITPFVIGKIQPHYDLMIMDCILTMVCGFITIAVYKFFESCPPSPPSNASGKGKDSSLFENFGALLQNKQMWLLGCVFSITTGLYYSMAVLLNQTLHSYGNKFSDSSVGLCGFLLMGTGIPGFLLSGYIIDRYKMYKLYIGSCLLMASISMCTLTYVLSCPESPLWLVLLMCSLLGFFLPLSQPAILELAIECTYPLSEEFSGSFCFFVVNFAAFSFPEIADKLQDLHDGNMTYGLVCMSGCLIFVFLLFISFGSTDYKRLSSTQ